MTNRSVRAVPDGVGLCDDAAVAVRAKELRFAVDLTAGGELSDENGVVLEVPRVVAEHLLLAALVRCSLQSLRHHAERGDVDVRSASGSSRDARDANANRTTATHSSRRQSSSPWSSSPSRRLTLSPSSSRWPSGTASSAPPSRPSRAIGGSSTAGDRRVSTHAHAAAGAARPRRGHRPRPAVERDRAQRQPQHVRGRRVRALGGHPRRLVRRRAAARRTGSTTPGGRSSGPD